MNAGLYGVELGGSRGILGAWNCDGVSKRVELSEGEKLEPRSLGFYGGLRGSRGVGQGRLVPLLQMKRHRLNLPIMITCYRNH